MPLEIGNSAIINSSAIISGITATAYIIGKVIIKKKNNNSVKDEECPDQDCFKLSAQTAVIAARNAEDIKNINKTIKDDIFPNINKTHDYIIEIKAMLGQAIETNGTKEANLEKFLENTVTAIVEKTLGFKTEK